ncbi:MAG: amidohydrolase, partial [bacterium]|nr:amidohydrolase [bacterium]
MTITAIKMMMEEYREQLIAFRRDLHMHPELSWKEVRTTAKIKEILLGLGIEIIEMGMETGVVGLLRGKNPGPTVAIRGDIDGLPLEEETEVPYKSKNPGVMHACGHDMHTTCVVGAAMMLAGQRERIQGNVMFIFQPAEEINEGARILVDKGVMEGVDAVFGLHVHPDVPAGKVGVKLGGLMAAVDT